MFFFKQKTAYEMRISAWSSDVCSSDLELRQFGRPRLQPVTSRLVQFHNLGKKQGLRRDAAAFHGAAHAFKDKSLMGCMLIHNHEPIFSLGNDIGLRHLPASHSQRKTPTPWRRCKRGFGATMGGGRCKTGAAGTQSRKGAGR